MTSKPSKGIAASQKRIWLASSHEMCMVPADEKGKFDEVVEEQGVRVLIDPGALMHVIGTKMDFVHDRLKYAGH